MEPDSAPNHSFLAAAYRATFQEYSNRLEALQSLMDSGSSDSSRIEATLLEVETARIAHSCARDRLAKELLRSTSALASQPVSDARESHIRETARLLWEMAGRPQGTADVDWHKAEKLVRTAATIAC